jgi:peptidoglycan biosynthesis protein MviN/MurJ (putative lipid II flippase)
MAGDKTGWRDCKAIGRAILYDRSARRKFIGRMLMAALLMMAAGLWLIDGWLAADVLRFLLWWAGCAGLTCLVMVFALYDMLAVIREERDKHP